MCYTFGQLLPVFPLSWQKYSTLVGTFASANKVAVGRAQLVLGPVNHLGIHPSQLSLHPQWVLACLAGVRAGCIHQCRVSGGW